MILINAENVIMGRLASFAAKKALEGEEVTIVNAEKVVITGTKEIVMKKLKVRLGLVGKGNPEKGPKFSRMPDRILRRSVRGMLPHKKSKGREAYTQVHAYIGIPAEFEGKKFEKIPGKEESRKNVELGTICKLLGAKW